MAERNTRIRRSQIADIAPADVTAYATNSPSDGYVPSYDLATGKWTWVENTGGSAGSSTYTVSFVNGDLVSGILTVTHNLGMTYPLVFIFDNNDKVITPDEIEYKTTNTVDIDLSSFGTLTGTWNVRIVGGTWSQDIIKDADNDTKIQVEESADEDIIRFDVFGSEMLQMTSSGISGSYIKDEDDMVSDSALHLSTQQSIKAYVDTSVAGLSPDKISEGDSLVEVVDLGTGYIKVEIDGIETARFGDGTVEELFELVNTGTNRALFINQTGISNTGKMALEVYSDAVQTNTQLVRFWQSNINSTTSALAITNDGTGYGTSILQRGNQHALQITNEGTSRALNIFSDVANPSLSLVKIKQNNVSSTTDVLEIVNNGTGQGIFLSQDGILASNKNAFKVTSPVAQTNSELVVFENNHASTTKDVLVIYQNNASATGTVERIAQNGTGHGLQIRQNGVLASNRWGLSVYSNAIQVNSPLVKFIQNNVSSDQSALYIDQNGTGYALEINSGNIILPNGTSINEFSIDGTLAGNSNTAIPTEKAVKTYVDNNAGDMSYSNTRFKIGSFTRDMTTVSGTQAITGIGFTPKAVIFLNTKNATLNANWGFSDVTNDLNIQHDSTPRFAMGGGGICLAYDDIVGNIYAGQLSAFGADGFTVTWTKTNSPTGTMTIYYLAFR